MNKRKLAFVLYANQLTNVTYLNGLPSTKIEKKLKESLGKTYEVTFHWEEAMKNKSVEAIIIPDPFPPICNEEKLPEIKIPASYFLNQEVTKIKEKIDTFFEKKE